MKRIVQVVAPALPTWIVWPDVYEPYYSTERLHMWLLVEETTTHVTSIAGASLSGIINWDTEHAREDEPLGYEEIDPQEWSYTTKEKYHDRGELRKPRASTSSTARRKA